MNSKLVRTFTENAQKNNKDYVRAFETDKVFDCNSYPQFQFICITVSSLEHWTEKIEWTFKSFWLKNDIGNISRSFFFDFCFLFVHKICQMDLLWKVRSGSNANLFAIRKLQWNANPGNGSIHIFKQKCIVEINLWLERRIIGIVALLSIVISFPSRLIISYFKRTTKNAKN